MEKITVDDIDPMNPVNPTVDRRDLSEPLDTSDLAMTYYTLDPGQTFSPSLHTHLDQEEVFYIIKGTATFETKPEATADSELIEVTAGEAVRFAPGEFQQGHNESDEAVISLALGAPRETSEGRVLKSCPECGESDVLAVVLSDDGMRVQCPECGTDIGPYQVETFQPDF